VTIPRVLDRVAALFDPSTLADLMDRSPVRIVPLGLLGDSGARFYEVLTGEPDDETGSPESARSILKDMRLVADRSPGRAGDERGREAAVLTASELASIHTLFTSPYRAVAREPGRYALLMDDVAGDLLSHGRGPLPPEAEARIVDGLARMHATFWESRKLRRLPWLLDAEGLLDVMGPRELDDPDDDVRPHVREGWREALARLPEPARTRVRQPAVAIAQAWRLPETLVHGDTRLTNFAAPGDGLTALDWGFAGRAPCTFDIGCYLAANAGRLSTDKDVFLATYRVALEGRRGGRFDDGTWADLEEAGVVCGARMFLWKRAAALVAGGEDADAEWAWWTDRLQRWARR